MRLSLRLILFLVAGISLVTFFIARNEVRSEKRGLRADLQRRAEVLAESLQEIVEPALGSRDQLRHIVERFGNRERLAGVIVYDADGKVLAESSTLVTRYTAPPLPLDRAKASEQGISEFVDLDRKPVHAYYLPLHNNGDVVGVLAIFHDASYIEAQSKSMWRETVWHVIAQVLLVVFITVLIIRWTVILPISRTAQWMKDLRVNAGVGPRPQIPNEDFLAPFSQEVVNLARSLAEARASAEEEARLREIRRVDVDRRAIANQRSEPAVRVPVCGLESRTLHARASGKDDRRAGSCERSSDRARAHSSRLRRHLDCIWIWRRRSRSRWMSTIVSAFPMTNRNTLFGAFGSTRPKRTATIMDSRMKACGLSATSPIRARFFAPPTGKATRRLIANSPMLSWRKWPGWSTRSCSSRITTLLFFLE